MKFDIFGEEYFLMHTKYSKKFNIELYYGRQEERAVRPAELIFTEDLKKILLENKSLSKYEFGEHLSDSMVVKLRRRLNQNPYNSLQEWIESTDEDKPEKITFLNPKEDPEIFVDYFGVKHILFSARIAPNGKIILIGKPLEEYKLDKYGRKLILTQELVDFIKEHRYTPVSGAKELGIHINTFKYLKNLTGYTNLSWDDMNIWLSAHLVEITSMTKKEFISQYMKDFNQNKGSVIRNMKNAFHNMKIFRDSKEKEVRKNLHILRTLDRKNLSDVLKLLCERLPKEKSRRCVQAYRVLMLAEEYNHPIPKELKGILKKKRLQ